jgi:GMP synthase-like glutamine amidotransferase
MKKKTVGIAFLFFCFTVYNALAVDSLTTPALTNNPSQDVIVTNTTPVLSFFNASGGTGKRAYIIQLDKDPEFKSGSLLEYGSVPEGSSGSVTRKMVRKEDALDDAAVYFWRVRAVDSAGHYGPWAYSRFLVNTRADDRFMNMVRVSPLGVEVSSGENAKNITDLDDPGQQTFWRGTPPGNEVQWVKFDLGEKKVISRVWMLSNINSPDGWLRDFGWQMSVDGQVWYGIRGSVVRNNETFRNILDFLVPVETRYLRLLITGWQGYSPQLNSITFYSPGHPKVPVVPEGDYVLIIGNQQNGFTFSALAAHVESLRFNLKTVTVPHYEASMSMLEKLDNKPIAIILSGNNTGYQNLPMFEYNGEYEIIRESDIPILGICCGHQQLAMAYGYTYASSMGWDDITALENSRTRAKITIERKDPVFEGIPNPFTAVEIHGWAITHLPEDFEVIARSTYIQALRNTERMIYGEQFHAEIKAPYNEGRDYIANFLKMALKKKKKH